MNVKNIIVIIVIVLIVLCSCVTIIGLGVGGFLFYKTQRETKTPFPNDSTFPNLIEPVSEEALLTLQTLEEKIVPNSDLRDLAYRLEGKENIPETVAGPLSPSQIGDKQMFWANNLDTNENFQVATTLRYITPHLYFWIEDDVNYDDNDLKELAETFENEIYPTNRQFFGSEWSPGVDNDLHLYVVFAGGLGYSIAGYFSSVDSVNPLAYEYSNAHETFMMNADTVRLDELFTYGVLAHEFQHMIHWYRDRNEDLWLNEGFSELAAFLNGYYESGFDSVFLSDPDLQLNDWPNDPNATTPHYGAGFLFVEYFLERFGDEATQALVAASDNGMDSVDLVLSQLGFKDTNTGESINAEDLFGDWAVTNYLDDDRVEDGRYVYERYTDFRPVDASETFDTCPIENQIREVSQYATDYIKFNCQGEYTLDFQGLTEVKVLPINANSGNYAFWSNKGDESDMTLTQDFDFSKENGPLTFEFSTWYDIEKDYDYVYLEVSTDGTHWEILTTPSGTAEDPSGNSYGWGFTGETIEWIQETVDISQFAGKKVSLRFEYVTDAAVNGEGILLDDISIPEIGYSTDFEDDDGGWKAAGFVRIPNRLPQTYILSLIRKGQETTVEHLDLDAMQHISIPLSMDGDTKEIILVVSGSTRFTRQPAAYRYSLK